MASNRPSTPAQFLISHSGILHGSETSTAYLVALQSKSPETPFETVDLETRVLQSLEHLPGPIVPVKAVVYAGHGS